jgi:hypothetical protein
VGRRGEGQDRRHPCGVRRCRGAIPGGKQRWAHHRPQRRADHTQTRPVRGPSSPEEVRYRKRGGGGPSRALGGDEPVGGQGCQTLSGELLHQRGRAAGHAISPEDRCREGAGPRKAGHRDHGAGHRPHVRRQGGEARDPICGPLGPGGLPQEIAGESQGGQPLPEGPAGRRPPLLQGDTGGVPGSCGEARPIRHQHVPAAGPGDEAGASTCCSKGRRGPSSMWTTGPIPT